MTTDRFDLDLVARACPVCGSDDDRDVVAEASIDRSRLDSFAFASRKVPEYMHHRLVQCPTCALLYATPAPAPDALGKLYADADYASGEESRYASATYASLLRQFVGTLSPGSSAIDVGTGDGAFLGELLDAGVEHVVGVEPSAAPIAAAEPRVRNLIREGVFDPAKFEDESFDLVTSFQTLEHLPAPLDLCTAAHRLLRPGGALLVVCHNRRAPLNRALGRRSPIYDIEHMQLFCPESLRSLLERSGFADVLVRPVTNRYPVRYWLQLLPLPGPLKAGTTRAVERARLGSRAVSLPVGNLAAVGFKPARTSS